MDLSTEPEVTQDMKDALWELDRIIDRKKLFIPALDMLRNSRDNISSLGVTVFEELLDENFNDLYHHAWADCYDICREPGYECIPSFHTLRLVRSKPMDITPFYDALKPMELRPVPTNPATITRLEDYPLPVLPKRRRVVSTGNGAAQVYDE